MQWSKISLRWISGFFKVKSLHRDLIHTELYKTSEAMGGKVKMTSFYCRNSAKLSILGYKLMQSILRYIQS